MRLITAVMRFSILFGSIIAFLLSFILIIVYHIHLDLSIYFQDAFRNIIAREALYYLGSRAFCVAVLSSFYVPVLGNIFATSNFTSMSFTGDAIHAAIPAFTHFLQVIHDPANSSRDFAFLCHSYHFAPQYT